MPATTRERPDFSKRLSALPTEPGVYLMKNADNRVIYVGKAIALRNRVRSYFQSTRHQDPKTRELVNHITDFEVIRTDTPTEALILENELIKRYQPKYNVMLKDSKTGKQGAADVIITIGAVNDPALARSRYIGTTKNKKARTGVAGSPMKEVMIDSDRGRYVEFNA